MLHLLLLALAGFAHVLEGASALPGLAGEHHPVLEGPPAGVGGPPAGVGGGN